MNLKTIEKYNTEYLNRMYDLGCQPSNEMVIIRVLLDKINSVDELIHMGDFIRKRILRTRCMDDRHHVENLVIDCPICESKLSMVVTDLVLQEIKERLNVNYKPDPRFNTLEGSSKTNKTD